MRPLILDYAIRRKEEMETVFHYDYTESLNIVIIGDEKKAFIDTALEEASLQTKTRVQRESDDNGPSLLELKTKTEVTPERDEDQSSLLELQTKTFVRKESDD